MTQRIQVIPQLPAVYDAYRAFADTVAKAADGAGVDGRLMELVKMRASQLNGCAFCLDMHSADAIELGEEPRRLFLLDAWRETDLYTDQERAALDLTEAITRLAQTQEVPDDVYERATAAFTDDQYAAIVWQILAINGWNRLTVPSHTPLPRRAR